MFKAKVENKILKERVCKFLSIGLSDAPKYGIVLTENGDVIYCFVPEILTFKRVC